jgi:biotin transport system substrate-specific component
MSTQQKMITGYFIQDKTLSLFEKLALIVGGSGILILSAKMMVPFWPIPLTFQPLAVIVLGVALGPRLALAATLTYLAEGAAGLPVFADAISYPGLSVLAKPSAGFLMSFPMAAFVAGWMAENDWTKSWSKSMALFGVSYVIMYGTGITWLIGMVGFDAALTSMWMWIPGDLAKIGLGVTSIQIYKAAKEINN